MSAQGYVTNSLEYNVKPPAVASRNIRSSINPSNGASFLSKNNATIKIDIPTGVRGQYVNTSQSYLKLKLGLEAAGGAYIDNSIYGIFSKMEIYHNGVLLESIDQYGALCNSLIDLQVEPDQRTNDSNIMLGTNLGNLGYGHDTAFQARYFCFPLVSGIIGPQQEKYLPIGNLQGDLRVELTLNSYGMWIAATPANNGFVVSDVELMLDIVELDASVSDNITRANGGQFQISATSWRNFNSSISPATTAASILIPGKFSSLKNILTIQRDQSKVTSLTAYSTSDRQGGSDFQSVQYRVGSYFVPQKPIMDVVEAYVETYKSLHALGVGESGSIDLSEYKGSSFVQGIELESLSHKSTVIQSGINTTSILIYYEPKFTAGRAGTTIVDSWCHYDLMLMIDGNGQASVAF